MTAGPNGSGIPPEGGPGPAGHVYAPILRPEESRVEAVGALYSWWSKLSGGRRPPRWSDVDVPDLRRWMGWLLIYDILDGGADSRYRLVGSAFAAAAGYDLTGSRLSERCYTLTPEVSLGILRRVVAHRDAAFQADRIVMLGGCAACEDRLWLPYSEDGDTIDRVMLYFGKVELLVHPFDRRRG